MNVSVKNLGKKFGNKVLFDDLNLDIEEGSFVFIEGVSGSGKTTLLNIIGLLDIDYKGSVLYNGQKISGKKKVSKLLRNDISYVFQNYGLVDNETVFFNLTIPLNIKKLKKPQQQELISKALEKVGLAGFELRKVHELSGGEQQRVAICKVFLKQPSLILADEPTGSLDEDNEDYILSLFLELKKMGCTIIMVSHNRKIAEYADKVISI